MEWSSVAEGGKTTEGKLMIRLLACSGRHFNDGAAVYRVLDEIAKERGGVKGADHWASQWAQARRVEAIAFPAKWEQYGWDAGVIRNALMLEDGRPDLVVAFPGGVGTQLMVRLAQTAGVEVIHSMNSPQ